MDLAYPLVENGQILVRSGAEFAMRHGLTSLQVPGPYDGMLTHPDEIADAIRPD
ncbi:hypothetical protein M2163_000520 [Streptomyces sp. SAI-135]|uniref:hypothetical protein n=1 Tax=unclassified Streptomyces TaxID=2593676 RepID=UPI002476AA5F|nr:MULTISPECIES: hypothetical protein [unclassified Streptomyces]MDH6522975.1 hypothetical protein [Streptomyces sp. SAI-090]MDH6554594.1 hypothetical protein [Streptomyces sp. SAI-041]MDH6573856.1 hypothetical protein [Streptomyces sp. SAI-117]MDH6581408.1 hypothetical protein [Streptomyces sp. SAI-133]MDH6613412.1 hypothetical protein [Streptomyces sp. SAI-135]